MDMTNVRVRHDRFGEGIVLSQVENYITIAFSAGEKRFIYPDAFEAYMAAVDPAIQLQVSREIEGKRQLERQAAEDAAARKALEISAKRAEEKHRSEVPKKVTSPKKETAPSQRISGQPNTYYVFQGKTFDSESHGGYIWAPISSRSGRTMHHWDLLTEVQTGDIILHGCDGKVMAISVAKDSCYECKQPDELQTEDLWEIEGRRVDCDYTMISNPITTSDFSSDIEQYCKAKYSPFNVKGRGNMGYLFNLDRDLAKIFILASIKKNKGLATVEFIERFLAE